MSKYHSKKVVVDGVKFDSKREAARWKELSLLERAGEITDLQRQVKFKLIPTQREFSGEIGKNGRYKKGKIIERECSYVADFTYKDKKGRLVVEDVKGYKGSTAYAVFAIKRKLMLYIHGIRVKEV